MKNFTSFIFGDTCSLTEIINFIDLIRAAHPPGCECNNEYCELIRLFLWHREHYKAYGSIKLKEIRDKKFNEDIKSLELMHIGKILNDK